MIPDWTIYYHDLSTFSSDDGGPEESPGVGVLAVVVKDAVVDYRVVHGGGPHFGQGFYWWDDGTWYVGDQWGLAQYLNEPGWKIVRFGQTVLNDRWAELWEKIESEIGVKSSRWHGERAK